MTGPRKKRRLDCVVVADDSLALFEDQQPDLDMCTAATITFGDGCAWNQMKCVKFGTAMLLR